MPSGLRRFQQGRQLHFITFSCHRRQAKLAPPSAANVFENSLEQPRLALGVHKAHELLAERRKLNRSLPPCYRGITIPEVAAMTGESVSTQGQVADYWIVARRCREKLIKGEAWIRSLNLSAGMGWRGIRWCDTN
jgi:hypothetical protein